MTLINVRGALALFAMALAAIMFASTVRAAPHGAQAASAAISAAPSALPIPSGARRPIRNTASKACTGVCFIPIYAVAQAQLLEIDSVSCVNTLADDNTVKYFALTNGLNLNNIIALIPATQQNSAGGGLTTIVANVSGPYFFGPGEGVFVLSGGSGYTVTCTVAGYVSAAQ